MNSVTMDASMAEDTDTFDDPQYMADSPPVTTPRMSTDSVAESRPVNSS